MPQSQSFLPDTPSLGIRNTTPTLKSPQITPLPYNFHTNLPTPSLLNLLRSEFFSSFSCHPIRIFWLILTRNVCCTRNGLAVHKEVILCFPFSVNFSDSLYYTSTLSSWSKPNPRLSESNSLPVNPPPPHITADRRRNTFPLTTIFQDFQETILWLSKFPLTIPLSSVDPHSPSFPRPPRFAESNSLPRWLSYFPPVCLTWSMSRPQGPTASM